MFLGNVLTILAVAAILGFATTAQAATIAYWKLDDLTGNDSVGTYSLSNLSGAQTTNIAPNPVPNPDTGPTAANPNAVGSSPVFQRSTADTTFNMTSSSSFTFEGWFQTGDVVDTGVTGVIGGNRRGSAGQFDPLKFRGWVVWMRDDGLVEFLIQRDFFGAEPLNKSIITTSQFDDSNPYHFAAVWDHDNGATGTFSLYVAGSLIGSEAGFGDLAEGNTNFTLGSRANPYPFNSWTGELDEMRFSNEALTQAQFLSAPEPSSLLLALVGLGLLASRRRRGT